MLMLSVIIPMLNVDKYISECICSVRNNTDTDMEIICIDAGSTDGTLEKVIEYAKTDKRIKVIHSDRKSYGYQVNKGIMLAEGKYFAVVESDDYVDTNMYYQMISIIEKRNLDVVKCGYNYVFEKKGIQHKQQQQIFLNDFIYEKETDSKENKDIFLCDNNIWTGIYKVDFIRKNHIFLNETDGAAFQDIGFMIQLHVHHPKSFYIKAPFYQYRYNRAGASTWEPKALQFAYQEIQFLFLNSYLSMDQEDFPYIYKRLSNIFVTEYEKVLRIQKYNINSEYLHKYYCGLKKIFIGSREKMCCNLQLHFLLENEIDYAYWLQDNDNKYEKWLKDLNESVGNRTIIIAGAGARGKNAFFSCEKLDIMIDAFCDNDKVVCGSCFWNIKIISVQKACQNFPNDCYLIASKKYAKEIKEQLLGLGIRMNQLVNFEPYRVLAWGKTKENESNK